MIAIVFVLFLISLYHSAQSPCDAVTNYWTCLDLPDCYWNNQQDKCFVDTCFQAVSNEQVTCTTPCIKSGLEWDDDEGDHYVYYCINGAAGSENFPSVCSVVWFNSSKCLAEGTFCNKVQVAGVEKCLVDQEFECSVYNADNCVLDPECMLNTAGDKCVHDPCFKETNNTDYCNSGCIPHSSPHYENFTHLCTSPSNDNPNVCFFAMEKCTTIPECNEIVVTLGDADEKICTDGRSIGNSRSHVYFHECLFITVLVFAFLLVQL